MDHDASSVPQPQPPRDESETLSPEQQKELQEQVDALIVAAHPISAATLRLVRTIEDTDLLITEMVPLILTRRTAAFDRLQNQLDAATPESDSPTSAPLPVSFLHAFMDVAASLRKLVHSHPVHALRSSLFIGLFSAYDTFTGQLLSILYERRPELLNHLQRSIPLSEIMSHKSFEDLRQTILRDEIETFRRKSYVEQFESLQSVFGIKLKAFARWPQFVEAAQRRNLFTHCDGIVSEQYVEVCRKEGYVFPSPVEVDDELELDDEYLSASCHILVEVAIMLSQTLWRKVLPAEFTDADNLLHELIYDALLAERYERAETLCEFGLQLKNLSNDLNRRIIIVNLAIARKRRKGTPAAIDVLQRCDWSSTMEDFKLAVSVLRDEYAEAVSCMRRIGTTGTLVTEVCYHLWPLFKEFRTTNEFLDGYREVYGYDFEVAARRRVTDEAHSLAQQFVGDDELGANETSGETATSEPQNGV